jgi:hypothetical protein
VDIERDYIEIFERYFEGEMSPEERQAFENNLASQSELNQEFKAYRAIRKGLAIERIKREMIAKGVGLSKDPGPIQVSPKGSETARYHKWLLGLLVGVLLVLGLLSLANRQREKQPVAPPSEEDLELNPIQSSDTTQFEPVWVVEQSMQDSPALDLIAQVANPETKSNHNQTGSKIPLPKTKGSLSGRDSGQRDAIAYLEEWVLMAIDLLPDGPSATRGSSDRTPTQAEELYPLIKEHLKTRDWKFALELSDKEAINPDDRDWIKMIALFASGQQEDALQLLRTTAEDRVHTYQMEAEDLLKEF